ncbi:unnamed protein product [Linum tenue]|uniref:Proline-rich protein PRCC n=1 Tax=Linum tenue TaxID=586396 RepID=A0AAV0RFG8_9ROSI|nr:unnamed protein product [Linum tenue]
MDSLVASYGSSDEDEPQQQEAVRHERQSSSYSTSSQSLPPARPSLPLFSVLPRPKSSSSSSPSPSIFSSSLPPPKSQNSAAPQPLSNRNPKRIVQFKPPPLPTYPDDEDDDEDERPARPSKSTAVDSSSVKSFLSSIPAPRSSSALGALPSSGSGRRSILQTDAPPSIPEDSVPDAASQSVFDQNVQHPASYGYSDNQSYDGSSYAARTEQTVGGGSTDGTYGEYYAADYGNCWAEGSSTAAVVVDDSAGRFMRGKRGRNEKPIEIIEVKQEELTKNRPRQDQVKSTGIAFGPSYQPVSTAKGKPSKLHKRKHQIGTLYLDMRQKEMELQERRSKGFLTKAQTQAKYGW